MFGHAPSLPKPNGGLHQPKKLTICCQKIPKIGLENVGLFPLGLCAILMLSLGLWWGHPTQKTISTSVWTENIFFKPSKNYYVVLTTSTTMLETFCWCSCPSRDVSGLTDPSSGGTQAHQMTGILYISPIYMF